MVPRGQKKSIVAESQSICKPSDDWITLRMRHRAEVPQAILSIIGYQPGERRILACVDRRSWGRGCVDVDRS